MAGASRLRTGRGGADSLFLVDIKDENLGNLETELCNKQAKRMEEALSAAEDLSVPGQKNIKVEASSMSFLPLYRDDKECCLLVFTDPQDKNTEPNQTVIEVQMTAVIQYLRGFHKEEEVKLFSKAPEGRRRSNRWTLIKERSNLELRRNFLTVRTINPWNSLPSEVVGAPSLEAFKKRLDSHLSKRV